MIDSHHRWNTRLTPLVWGFFLAVLLTLAAYFCVTEHLFSGWTLIYVIFGMCVLQAFVLLTFYMHLFLESKPRWNLLLFLFLVLVVVVVIGGTLWIMHSLDYNVMLMMHAQ